MSKDQSVDTHPCGKGLPLRPRSLKVLIADDHRLMLSAIGRVLADRDDIELVGQATSGEQVLPLALRTRPDVVLLDIRMPGMDGIECARRVRAQLPGARILMLTAYGDPESVEAAQEAGADGYILKSVAAVDLAGAIHGSAGADGFLLVGFPDRDEGVDLTDRETAVLRAVCEGLTNRQIGRELWISEQTVKFHLKKVFRKLDAANRKEAVERARERGLMWPGGRTTVTS